VTCSAQPFVSYCLVSCLRPDAGADASTLACAPGYVCSGGVCAVPGPPVSDIATRYDTTTPDAGDVLVSPGVPLGATQRLCSTPVVLAGELAATDPTSNRSLKTGGGCITSPYADPQDVYAVELAGTGPHTLEVDSCGISSIPMEVMLFQKPGSMHPYDTANSCKNLITSWEPSGQPNCNGGVFARSINLSPGIVYVVISSQSGEFGSYQLKITSSTSTCR
jgi:hypothetical protein